MTDKEINERVAKLCGWDRKPFVYGTMDENDEPIQQEALAWYKDGHGFRCFQKNYAESLDACREFMDELHGLDRCDFVDIARHSERASSLYDYEHHWALITMTARELCECFLKLKGQ